MKIINRSAFVQEDGTLPLPNRLKGILQFGFTWQRDVEALSTVVQRLQRVLSGKFVLIRGLSLPGLRLEIPGVLVGPGGIYVFYASALRGIYRIKGNRMARMDTTTRQFKPAEPNVVRRTQLMAKAVQAFFQRKGVEIPLLEPVLVFTEAGIHIDAARPAVRLVQIDVLDRFAARLMQSRRRLSPEDVDYLVRLLLNPTLKADRSMPVAAEEEPAEVSGLEALSFEEPLSKTLPPAMAETAGAPEEEDSITPEAIGAGMTSQLSDSPLPAAETVPEIWALHLPGLGRIAMQRRQWLLLGAMAGLEFLLLLMLVLMILFLRL